MSRYKICANKKFEWKAQKNRLFEASKIHMFI